MPKDKKNTNRRENKSSKLDSDITRTLKLTT